MRRHVNISAGLAYGATTRRTRFAVRSIEPVSSLDDPRLAPYRILREPELLREKGLFIAESRRVVETLLTRSRFTVQSIFVTPTAQQAMSSILAAHAAQVPVYVGTRELMNEVAGFNIHRGCLAAGVRESGADLETLLGALPESAVVVVTEAVSDPDNMGAIFRNAFAFGCSAVVLAAGSADPLYRKSIRVSLGSSLLLPFAHAPDWPEQACQTLQRLGFRVVALTPHPPAQPLVPLPAELLAGRVALLVGAEGEGLSRAALERADYRMRIPMANEVDSINVASATAVALHALTNRSPAMATAT